MSRNTGCPAFAGLDVEPGLAQACARNDVFENYLSLIGAAVFSAGAGGNAVAAPAFCASASGRAGSGGTSLGRAPVVVGSGGADGLVSAPGVDCNGCVACAICRLLALSWASERPDTASPDAINAHASSISIL